MLHYNQKKKGDKKMTTLELVKYWCEEHNFKTKTIDKNILLWQTNISTCEYNDIFGTVTYHEKEYFEKTIDK